MAEGNLELAREVYEAWNRGDSDWVTEHLTADAEMRPLRERANFDEVYVGQDGWKDFWKDWRREWSRVEVRVQRLEDMGNHGVLVLLSVEGVGKEREEEVKMPVSHWLQFRDGLISAITVMAPDAAERRHAQRD
jgi:ketosteroid isomerase-like protein